MTSKHRQFLIDNPEYIRTPEGEVRREMDRLGVENEPCPDVCPKCKGELTWGGGMVGEPIAYCENDDCDEFIVWEDHEAAIRAVY